MNDQELAAVAKALGHPARLQILRLLAGQSECRGADVFAELPLAQSTISQHLAVLKDAGVISSHSVAQSSVYCLSPAVLGTFCAEVTELARTAVSCSPDTEECR